MTPIRWHWDLGIGLSGPDSSHLLALLGAVRETQTLGRAAALAGLSYRAAWGLLRLCESRLGRPLVVKGRGIGTQLSELGEQLYQLDFSARLTLQELHAPWANRLQELLAPSSVILPERLHIAASHDLALADWIENGRRVHVDIYWRGSEEALLALSRGECEAAGFHVPDTWTGERAIAWMDRWLPARHFAFFPVMRRQQGLLVAAGNPFAIGSLADVARLGLRMVNRQRGSGTRRMIDQLLAANGLHAQDLPGYAHEEFTHDAVATAIASGQADVGLGIQSVATRYDLGFIPLARDVYCLAASPGVAASGAMRQLIRRFQGNTFHERLRALTGYEPAMPSQEFIGVDALVIHLNQVRQGG